MRERIVLTALAVSTFFYVTVETLPIGLLPQIADGVQVTDSSVGLLVTAYGLVVVIATIPLTRLTHRWSRRRLLATLILTAAVATTISALAPAYPTLLAGRVLAALSQAVFWAVVTPAAASLFALQSRGRAIAVLYAGSSAGPLLGVPAGTWLGQQAGWRVPFLALSVVGLAIATVIITLMPSAPPGSRHADRGTAPDRTRYRTLVVAVAVTVTGAFIAITVITPFLTGVTGVRDASISPILLIRGIAGLAGATAAGFVAERRTWHALVALTALETAALAALYAFSADPPLAIAAIAAASTALSGMVTVLGTRVLQVAPGSTDMAAAGTSTAFNVGITVGALIGSLMLTSFLRESALLATAIAAGGLATFLIEPRLAARLRPADPPTRSAVPQLAAER
ncbi:MFS transporter [Actinoplanes sp. KI2]|uniref:MFS transporter n=1 Tax=Actinoplanes sp. KI2 TaxID=2983315 RepID=UPI0021D5D854|nr:MFS transporter [Actinoplanes sp. KI2]MCU7730229.1 MFS transporter [Actinoplanes sp. KI2]